MDYFIGQHKYYFEGSLVIWGPIHKRYLKFYLKIIVTFL